MGFWKKLGKGLVKVGEWVIGNPDEVIAIVQAGKKIKKGVKK